MGVAVESLLEVDAAAVDFSGTVDRVELLLLLLLLVLPDSDSVNDAPNDPESLPSIEGVAAGVPSSEAAAALPRLGRALSLGANLAVPLSMFFFTSVKEEPIWSMLRMSSSSKRCAVVEACGEWRVGCVDECVPYRCEC
jgi:hypothetical protein